MRLLIDTNIFLEVLLERDNAHEVRKLLSIIDRNYFYLTDFTFHSLGVILFRKRKSDVFRMFVNDIIIEAGFEIISLLPEDVEKICEASAKFNLDFDDAYQYTAGKEYNLSIVSFDSDFDGTDRGRKKPSELFE